MGRTPLYLYPTLSSQQPRTTVSHPPLGLKILSLTELEMAELETLVRRDVPSLCLCSP